MKDDSVLHANLAVFHFLLLSVLFLGGEAPLIAGSKIIPGETEHVVAPEQP